MDKPNKQNEKVVKRSTKRLQIKFTEPSLTKQEFKEETDINYIIKRATITGELPSSQKTPVYGDFTNGPQDYKTALNMVLEAQEQFDSFPSKVRDRFKNDPAELLAFVANEQNRDEAIALGLIEKPEEKIIQKELEKTK